MNKEQEIIKNLQSCIDRQKAEIERLTLSEREAYKRLERGNERMMAIIAEEREDAIKEFAERLLDKYDIWTESDETEYRYVEELVDNLVKEMTKKEGKMKGE